MAFGKKKLKSPWTKLYNGVLPHLKYFDGSISEYLEYSAGKYPDYKAYNYFGITRTYRELIKKIEQTAKALKKHGVKENDKVTICMPNTPQGIIMFYAVNMVGAIANMVHPLSSEKEIEYYLTSSESKILLVIDIAYGKVMNIINNTKLEKVIVATGSDELGFIPQIAYWILKSKNKKMMLLDNRTTSWQLFYESGRIYDGNFKVKRKPTDPAVILYSGGTTGNPKGILLSNLNFNALALQSHLMCDPSKEGDSILAIMPIFHGFGIGVCIHTPLCAGMCVILIPQFKAKEFDNLIEKYQPNFIAGVPTLFEALVKTKGMSSNALSSVTCIVSGGDTLPLELKNKIEDFLKDHGSNAIVRVGYGLTECVAASCLTPSNYFKEGSIGVPFPDMYYKIVKNGTHDEVDFNEDGEICINGPTVMMGYFNNTKETMQVLRKHDDGKIWLHTGDIGCMDKDGLVYFKQRIKRIIISSGYNIYPSYIESIIDKHPAVLTSTVIGIDHPYKIQVAKAFIVLKEGIELNHKLKEDIKEYCQKNIAKYAMPYEFEYRDSIPRTLVGKIAYAKLKEEAKNER